MTGAVALYNIPLDALQRQKGLLHSVIATDKMNTWTLKSSCI